MNYIRLPSTTLSVNPTSSSLITSNNQQSSWLTQIFDPGGQFITRWNYIFLITCLNALFVDPLYFLVPEIARRKYCMRSDYGFAAVITVWRCLIDVISFIHIFIKFRTAYVAPNSRVFGRGDLVRDPKKIALRYLRTGFVVDLAAALPLPQLFIWFVIPAVRSPTAAHANHSISLVIIIQYIPRLFVIFPLNQRITKTTGVIAKTAWAGAAYYIMLYMLASHAWETMLKHGNVKVDAVPILICLILGVFVISPFSTKRICSLIHTSLLIILSILCHDRC